MIVICHDDSTVIVEPNANTGSSERWPQVDVRTPLLSKQRQPQPQPQQQRNQDKRPIYGNKFRYVVGLIMIISMTMHTYGNYTLYIAAIRMISGDVLTSGMTGLRAKHLDQFHLNRDSAPIGTCPIESPPSTMTSAHNHTGGETKLLLDAAERDLYNEANTLYGDVASQVAAGQLVDWTIQQRGLIFAAQKVGAVLGDVPISRLSLKYGTKLMVLIGIGSSALRSLFLPLVAGHTSFWFTFTFELIMGLLGETIICNLYPITASWFLPEEASAFFACFHLSYILGPTFTNLISTQLLAHSAGWWWCFYLGGSILTVMTLLWAIIGADRPDKSRFVTSEELRILQNSVANSSAAKQMDMSSLGPDRCICPSNTHTAPGEEGRCPAREIKRVPKWTTIAKCPTVWALIATNFACYWNTNTGTLWPTFFANILHWDASTIGLITSLKGVVGLFYGATFAYGTRKLAIQRPFNMSLTTYRRLCQLLATLFLAASLFLMVVYDCSMLANSLAIMLTPIVNGFNVISFYQVPLDISPEDSGLIGAVVRTLAFGDVIASPVSSYILSFASSPSSVAGDRFTWRLVWLFTLALKLIACIWFCLFAECEPKSYSNVKPAGVCRTRLGQPDEHKH